MLSNRGFTLIELMVTIAVMAILAMIAAPSMSNMVAKQRLNTTAKDLAYTFGLARSQAAALRKQVTVDFDSQPNTATAFYWASKYDDVILTSDPIQVKFKPTGVADTRTKMINNPAYNPTQPISDSNPKQIEQVVPLSFSVCSKKLKETRTIGISVTGVVDKIQNVSGGC